MFTGLSKRYDLANRILSLGLDRRWRQQAVGLCRTEEKLKVLDICCGTGDMAFAVAENTNAAEIVGCDISPAMLELAAAKEHNLRKSGRLAHTHFEWLCDDFMEITFQPAQFDLVTCAFGIRNMENPARILQLTRNLLKPRGDVCILEFSLPAWLPARILSRVYLGVAVPLVGQLITADRKPYDYLRDSIKDWAQNVDLPALLEDAGFGDVKVRSLTAGIASINTASARD